MSKTATIGNNIILTGFRLDELSLRKSIGKIIKLGTYDVHFKLDALSGQSGSPVYKNDTTGPYAVGIYNYSAPGDKIQDDNSPENNTAARINGARFTYLSTLKSEFN